MVQGEAQTSPWSKQVEQVDRTAPVIRYLHSTVSVTIGFVKIWKMNTQAVLLGPRRSSWQEGFPLSGTLAPSTSCGFGSPTTILHCSTTQNRTATTWYPSSTFDYSCLCRDDVWGARLPTVVHTARCTNLWYGQRYAAPQHRCSRRSLRPLSVRSKLTKSFMS